MLSDSLLTANKCPPRDAAFASADAQLVPSTMVVTASNHAHGESFCEPAQSRDNLKTHGSRLYIRAFAYSLRSVGFTAFLALWARWLRGCLGSWSDLPHAQVASDIDGFRAPEA